MAPVKVRDRLDEDALVNLFLERGIDGARSWRPATDERLFGEGIYYVGRGRPAFEVCVVPAARRPRRDEVRDLWRSRQGRQAAPLLLICPFLVDETLDAQVLGPTEQDLLV